MKQNKKLMEEIPDRFWGLFRSVNRSTYIEALLRINEEYEYSNYFLSREVCIQVLSEYFAKKRYVIWQDELEDELDTLEPPATRVLNWLLKTGWLRKVDDYASMTVYIVIPDYAAVMTEAFLRLDSEDEDETQIYIQNVYAILFSLKNDPRASISLLNTAFVNTKRLNKTLQDMLHNMDKFFASLLEQKSYEDLLRDHLEGYVEEIVKKKYHILKTSDNFYLYKTDIKRWIAAMREDTEWMEQMSRRSGGKVSAADIAEKLDQIEAFHPERMASRILGMGDMLTFIEKAEQQYDEEQAKKLEEKLRKNRLTLSDYLDQLEQLQNMGDLSQIADMLPGGMAKGFDPSQIDEKQMAHNKAIIRSMTPKERENPQILNASRKKRIAAGCGLEVVDVNRLLKSFEMLQQMTKAMTKGKFRGLGGMMGGMPNMNRMHGFGRKKRLK